MPDKRIIDYNEAESLSSDDYLIIDGNANGTRKIKPNQLQVATDKTLSIEDTPADAKKVGDEITGIKADLNDILENDLVNRPSDYTWGLGTINATTGASRSSTTRIRTAHISPIKEGVEVNSGYKYIVYVYDSEKVFLGAFVNGEYVKGGVNWTTGKTFLSSIPDEYFLRLLMAKDDDSNITASENVNLTLLSFTDTTLTQSGKAADAKVVGDKISSAISFQKIEPYATVKGYLKTDGAIITSGGLYSKYINRGYNRIYLNGKSSLSSAYSILWFVKNGAMVTSVLNGAETMVDTEVEVPSDIEEIWFYVRSDEIENYINVMSATDHIARQAIDKNADDISTANSNIAGLEAQIAGQISIGAQWNGKKWYAYGTSLTNINNEGKYATYLANLSGMQLTNKGISGGGIGNLGAYARGQVYSAICNTTDGKLEADLITLETGANDVNDDVPLGTIYDTGTETLAGCLNDCIQYLLANTTAQIAIMPSPIGKNTSNKLFEWAAMIKQICDINRVTYISPNDNIGKARANSSQAALYYVDNVHQTELGGYVLAEYMWYQLRNIPLFHTTMPA